MLATLLECANFITYIFKSSGTKNYYLLGLSFVSYILYGNFPLAQNCLACEALCSDGACLIFLQSLSFNYNSASFFPVLPLHLRLFPFLVYRYLLFELPLSYYILSFLNFYIFWFFLVLYSLKIYYLRIAIRPFLPFCFHL